jgi:hypothetical protein
MLQVQAYLKLKNLNMLMQIEKKSMQQDLQNGVLINHLMLAMEKYQKVNLSK